MYAYKNSNIHLLTYHASSSLLNNMAIASKCKSMLKTKAFAWSITLWYKCSLGTSCSQTQRPQHRCDIRGQM